MSTDIEVAIPALPGHTEDDIKALAALFAPFPPEQVRARPGDRGMMLHYLTARSVMTRLDDVIGPGNWEDSYRATQDGLMCRLEITLPSGKRIAKEDGGGFAPMKDEDDAEKSGYSSAYKRAAVKIGIGRYLYGEPLPGWVYDMLPGVDWTPRAAWYPGGGRGQDNAPPSQARPPVTPEAARRPPADQREQPRRAGDFRNGDGKGQHSTPRSGKALYAWTLDAEKRHEVGLLKYLNNWAKLQEFPGRMVDWDAEQVALAFAEATRKLESHTSGNRGDAFEEGSA